MDHCNESANWPAQSVTMIEQYVRTIVAVTSCTNIQQLSTSVRVHYIINCVACNWSLVYQDGARISRKVQYIHCVSTKIHFLFPQYNVLNITLVAFPLVFTLLLVLPLFVPRFHPVSACAPPYNPVPRG